MAKFAGKRTASVFVNHVKTSLFSGFAGHQSGLVGFGESFHPVALQIHIWVRACVPPIL